jgi:hypothetical protein
MGRVGGEAACLYNLANSELAYGQAGVSAPQLSASPGPLVLRRVWCDRKNSLRIAASAI